MTAVPKSGSPKPCWQQCPSLYACVYRCQYRVPRHQLCLVSHRDVHRKLQRNILLLQIQVQTGACFGPDNDSCQLTEDALPRLWTSVGWQVRRAEADEQRWMHRYWALKFLLLVEKVSTLDASFWIEISSPLDIVQKFSHPSKFWGSLNTGCYRYYGSETIGALRWRLLIS